MTFCLGRNRRARHHGRAPIGISLESLEDRRVLATLTVGTGADFDSIQTAINNATAGDIIEVANGNYNESLDLSTMGSAVGGTRGDITIRGESENVQIESTSGPVITSSTAFSANIVLQSLTVRSTGDTANDDSGVVFDGMSGSLSFTNVFVRDTVEDGFHISNYTGDISMRTSEVVNSGSNPGDIGMAFVDVNGTIFLLANAVRDVADTAVLVENNNSSSVALSYLSNALLGDFAEFTTINDGLVIHANDNATVDASIVGNNFDDSDENALQMRLTGNAQVQSRIADNFFFNNNSENLIDIRTDDNSHLSLSFENNNSSDSLQTLMSVVADDTSQINANIDNNLFFSGGDSAEDEALAISTEPGSDATINVSLTFNNFVTVTGNGLHVTGGGTSTINVQALENTFSDSNDLGGLSAFLIDQHSAADSPTILMDIELNSADDNGADSFRIHQQGASVFNLETDGSEPQPWLEDRNTGNIFTLIGNINATDNQTIDQFVPILLGGTIWDDASGDGIRQAGENGLENLTLTLSGTETDSGATIQRTTLTDVDGQYVFSGLLPGSYTVMLEVPVGQIIGIQDAGDDDDIDSDFVAGTQSATVALTQNTQNIDAGLVPGSNAPWQNPRDRFDVDDDGNVFPIDALRLINFLNDRGTGPLPVPTQQLAPPPYVDVTGDNNLFAIDALQLINRLNNPPAKAAGEGEAVVADDEQATGTALTDTSAAGDDEVIVAGRPIDLIWAATSSRSQDVPGELTDAAKTKEELDLSWVEQL